MEPPTVKHNSVIHEKGNLHTSIVISEFPEKATDLYLV